MPFDELKVVPTPQPTVPEYNPHGYNLELFAKIADAIEAEEIARFDMRVVVAHDYTHPCGTAGCIKGFGGMILRGWKSREDYFDPDTGCMQGEDFGISASEESILLFPGTVDVDGGWRCGAFPERVGHITRQHALNVIRNGILKGEKIDEGIWDRHAPSKEPDQ